MRTAIVTSHLYGHGGGADVVYWLSKAMQRHGEVIIFSATSIPQKVMDIYVPPGIPVAQHFAGCAVGFDLLINIDHYHYEAPTAAQNWAFIFHPHAENHIRQGYDTAIANSAFTAETIGMMWQIEATTLYTPIRKEFVNPRARKKKMILHCSRFSKPYPTADKGHTHMLYAFRVLHDRFRVKDWDLVMVGSMEDEAYAKSLREMATGYPVRFLYNAPQDVVEGLFNDAAFYWHFSGYSDPLNRGCQEHLGLTTIQAMCSGGVPIVRGTGGQTEIVTDGRSGLFVTRPDELADSTAALITNMSSWGALRTAALEDGIPWTDEMAFYDRVDSILDVRPMPELPTFRFIDRREEDARVWSADDITVVIPTIGNWRGLEKLLLSLKATEADVLKTIIVGSGDQCGETFPLPHEMKSLAYLHSEEQLTYAEAVNLGVDSADTDLVLILNDDVYPILPWLSQWIHFLNQYGGMVEDEPWVFGMKLMTPGGRLQHAGLMIDLSRSDIGYHRWYLEDDRPAANQVEAVPAVTGACMLARKELFPLNHAGGLNYEDLDLCLRSWEQGHPVIYEPRVFMIHEDSITKRTMPSEDLKNLIWMNYKWFLSEWSEKLADNYSGMPRLLEMSRTQSADPQAIFGREHDAES